MASILRIFFRFWTSGFRVVLLSSVEKKRKCTMSYNSSSRRPSPNDGLSMSCCRSRTLLGSHSFGGNCAVEMSKPSAVAASGNVVDIVIGTILEQIRYQDLEPGRSK